VKEFAVYTVARLGLFVASYAVVVGVYMLFAGTHAVPLLWPFFVAVVISAVASYYLLKGPRERFAAKVGQRAAAASRRFEEARAKEDLD
jgi:hypothetical protein